MESKIDIFFGKFAFYIVGILMLISIGLGCGWYVSNTRLEAKTEYSKRIETQLEVSNASYNSIKDQFALLTSQLEANQEKALASHALLQEKLSTIVEADKTREGMEKYLLNRQVGSDCKMPKDLVDAWTKN